MAANFLKNGLVAIFFAVKHICRVLNKYGVKVSAAIDQLQGEGRITSDQATQLKTWLENASSACNILQLLTEY